MTKTNDISEAASTEYVTVTVGGQMFGLPIASVQDVFVPEQLTRVPLAPPDVAGVLNLRGRVVTAIDMRCRLDLGRRDETHPMLAIGIAYKAESYGLLVDAVGEVMRLADADRENNPANLDPRLACVASSIHRLDNQLMVVLDVERVLDLQNGAIAA